MLDNFTFDKDTGDIFADYVGLTDESVESLSKGEFPYPSLEIHYPRKMISGVACLGGTEPHFKLTPVIPEVAQAQFSAEEMQQFQLIPFPPPPESIAEGLARRKIRDITWETLDRLQEGTWMFGDLVKATKENPDLTDDQKDARIRKLQDELNGVLSTVTEMLVELPNAANFNQNNPPAPAPSPPQEEETMEQSILEQFEAMSEEDRVAFAKMIGLKEEVPPPKQQSILEQFEAMADEDRTAFAKTVGPLIGISEEAAGQVQGLQEQITQFSAQHETDKDTITTLTQRLDGIEEGHRQSQQSARISAALDRLTALGDGSAEVMFNADTGTRHTAAPALIEKATHFNKSSGQGRSCRRHGPVFLHRRRRRQGR